MSGKRGLFASLAALPWWVKSVAGYAAFALVTSAAGTVMTNAVIDHASDVMGEDLAALYAKWQEAYAATKGEARAALDTLGTVAQAAVEDGARAGKRALEAWMKLYDPLGLLTAESFTPRERPPEAE